MESKKYKLLENKLRKMVREELLKESARTKVSFRCDADFAREIQREFRRNGYTFVTKSDRNTGEAVIIVSDLDAAYAEIFDEKFQEIDSEKYSGVTYSGITIHR